MRQNGVDFCEMIRVARILKYDKNIFKTRGKTSIKISVYVKRRKLAIKFNFLRSWLRSQ
jgi:hypothetical protein